MNKLVATCFKPYICLFNLEQYCKLSWSISQLFFVPVKVSLPPSTLKLFGIEIYTFSFRSVQGKARAQSTKHPCILVIVVNSNRRKVLTTRERVHMFLQNRHLVAEFHYEHLALLYASSQLQADLTPFCKPIYI